MRTTSRLACAVGSLTLAVVFHGTADALTRWYRSYGVFNGGATNHVEALADGSVAAGYAAEGQDGNASVARLDRHGAVLWTRTIGGAGFDYFSVVRQGTDGSFLAGGMTDSFGP